LDYYEIQLQEIEKQIDNLGIRPLLDEQSELNTLIARLEKDRNLLEDLSKQEELWYSKPWPSTPESVANLERLLAEAKGDSDRFHRDAQIDLKTLHEPMTI
jgi:hypothetical protein